MSNRLRSSGDSDGADHGERNPFSLWSGCTSATTVTCNVTMSSNTVTANYGQPTVTQVTVAPNRETATTGTQVQFTATVTGTGNFANTANWPVTGPSTWTGSAGSISSGGLYDTPYPAPATVTVVATSTQDTTKSGSAAVTLQPPATAAGPALEMNVGNQTHAISPYIYGVDAYSYDQSVDGSANVAVLRWGGDNTSGYNYQNGNTSFASDWYFENQSSVYGMPGTPQAGEFNDLVTFDQSIGAITLGTVPVLGWVAKNDATACSFPLSTYPNQQSVDATRRGPNGKHPQHHFSRAVDHSVSGAAVKTTAVPAGLNLPDVRSRLGESAEGSL